MFHVAFVSFPTPVLVQSPARYKNCSLNFSCYWFSALHRFLQQYCIDTVSMS